MGFQYKEEQHPQRPAESRLLVTWPGYGWWHNLGSVVCYAADSAEAWPAHGLHRDVSRIFNSRDDAVRWLKLLWEERQAKGRGL